MSTKRIAVPAVLALALAMVAVAAPRQGPIARKRPRRPSTRFFQAAQRGDAPAFLATLAGTLRSSFESTQSQIGAEAFAASLRESVAGMKGFAVSPAGQSRPTRPNSTSSWSSPTATSVSGSSCSGRAAVGWLPRIDKADTVKPPIPYGAPAFEGGILTRSRWIPIILYLGTGARRSRTDEGAYPTLVEQQRGSAAVLIVSFVGLTLPAPPAQAIEPAPAAPVVMETSAVTLELVCRDARGGRRVSSDRLPAAGGDNLGRQSAVACRPDRLCPGARRPRPP